MSSVQGIIQNRAKRLKREATGRANRQDEIRKAAIRAQAPWLDSTMNRLNMSWKPMLGNTIADIVIRLNGLGAIGYYNPIYSTGIRWYRQLTGQA